MPDDAIKTSTATQPAYIEKSEQEWLEGHATRNKKGDWVCKETGAIIQCLGIGRSIHSSDFPGAGSGEVRLIAHVWCPRCGTKPNVRWGTSVNESDLIKIH